MLNGVFYFMNYKRVQLLIPWPFAFFSFSTNFDAVSNIQPTPNFTSEDSSYKKPRFPLHFKFSKSKLLRIVPILLFILVAGVVIVRAISSSSNNLSNTSVVKKEVAGAKAKEDLRKNFSFPLKDDKGKEISTMMYSLESAELLDEIIIKGQTARAVSGRTFLIITMKLTNNYRLGIKINTRDYIRLSVNNSSERLAPEIHNDPVEVQAISTKYTRVGFAINENDRNLVLQVGEIDGPKETINLTIL